jgi:hypothetical protein
MNLIKGINCRFTNQDDGAMTIRHAPLGLIVEERWSVQEGLGGGPNQGPKELVLAIELMASKFILPLFKNMMEKNHRGYIDGMVNVILEDKTMTTT